MSGQHPDKGFTLIEVLLVILVLGLMATVVVAAAGGFTGEAEDSGCDADRRSLAIAAERYFAEMKTDVIPPADATDDGVEQTLAAVGFLRGVSILHDVETDGVIVPSAASPCTLPG